MSAPSVLARPAKWSGGVPTAHSSSMCSWDRHLPDPFLFNLLADPFLLQPSLQASCRCAVLALLGHLSIRCWLLTGPRRSTGLWALGADTAPIACVPATRPMASILGHLPLMTSFPSETVTVMSSQVSNFIVDLFAFLVLNTSFIN